MQNLDVSCVNSHTIMSGGKSDISHICISIFINMKPSRFSFISPLLGFSGLAWGFSLLKFFCISSTDILCFCGRARHGIIREAIIGLICSSETFCGLGDPSLPSRPWVGSVPRLLAPKSPFFLLESSWVSLIFKSFLHLQLFIELLVSIQGLLSYLTQGRSQKSQEPAPPGLGATTKLSGATVQTLFSVFHTLSRWSTGWLTETLWGWNYCYPHFTDAKMRVQRPWPKVHGKAGIWIRRSAPHPQPPLLTVSQRLMRWYPACLHVSWSTYPMVLLFPQDSVLFGSDLPTAPWHVL